MIHKKAIILTLVYVVIIGAVTFLALKTANNTSANSSSSSNKSSSKTASTTALNSSNPYTVLSPATVLPKVSECQQTISYATDGNPSPYECSNGQLNALAWNALSGLELSVMTLGYSATESQVQATICRDIDTNAGTSIEQTAYNISALYYGWNFSTNPSNVLINGSC